MTRLLQRLLAFLVAALLLPGAALGHGGAEPVVHVPLDHVVPGQPFPLIGADMAPNSVVSIKLVRGKRAVPLGRVTAGTDGHFSTTRVAPPNFPKGYAQAVAADPEGSRATAWILFGERKEAVAPPPVADTPSSDGPSAAVIAVIIAGAVAALAATAAFALGRRTRRGSHAS